MVRGYTLSLLFVFTACQGADTLGVARASEEAADNQPTEDSIAQASSLVISGGSGTDEDLPLVAVELAKFGPAILRTLANENQKIVVCHDSVTDYLTDLRGVHPGGWPADATWDRVPGTFDFARRETVIALRLSPEGYRMPHYGQGHRSHNLTLHETAHALDWNALHGRHSTSDLAFADARTADLASLSTYELQWGNTGLQETYAESAARYFGNDSMDAVLHPHLHAYWDGPGQARLVEDGMATVGPVSPIF